MPMGYDYTSYILLPIAFYYYNLWTIPPNDSSRKDTAFVVFHLCLRSNNIKKLDKFSNTVEKCTIEFQENHTVLSFQNTRCWTSNILLSTKLIELDLFIGIYDSQKNHICNIVYQDVKMESKPQFLKNVSFKNQVYVCLNNL